MEFIEKSDTVERVYSVFYDKENLTKLLDEIIKKTSYRTTGKFTAPYDATYKGKVFTSGANLPNGDPMFENIKEIYRFTSKGPYSYHGDSIAVEGTIVTPPELVDIIMKILKENQKGIVDFLNYKNNSELIPIDEKIDTANKAIDAIDNFSFEEKIEAIKTLEKYCNEKKEKRYFDVELLKQYYLKACSLIGLSLISEKTIMHDQKILLKDYIPLNK